MSEIKSVQVADGVSFFVPQVSGIPFSEVEFIYQEIFQDRTYLKHGIALSDASRIIDAGANVGIFSIFVAQQYPAARILAFEPIPAIHEALCSNLDAFGVSSVDVRRLALGEKAESGVTFTFYPAVPGNSTRYPEQKKVGQEIAVAAVGQAEVDRVMRAEHVEVDVERLSTVLAQWAPDGPIDLLKVDVEGAELEVLKGLDDADWDRIRQAVLEVQDLDNRLAEVTSLLGEHGFTVVAEPAANLPDVYRYSMVYATR